MSYLAYGNCYDALMAVIKSVVVHRWERWLVWQWNDGPEWRTALMVDTGLNDLRERLGEMEIAFEVNFEVACAVIALRDQKVGG